MNSIRLRFALEAIIYICLFICQRGNWGIISVGCVMYSLFSEASAIFWSEFAIVRCIVEGEQANMLVDNTDQREEVLYHLIERDLPCQSSYY